MDTTNGIQVTVDMGDDYRPSERLTGAIKELVAALNESHGDVEGYAYGQSGGYLNSVVANWSPVSGFSIELGAPPPTPSPDPVRAPRQRSF